MDHHYIPQLPAYATWLSHLSFGGLKIPVPDFMETIRRREQLFLCFAVTGTAIPKGKGIVCRLTDKIVCRLREEQLPQEVVRRFVKLRIIIRIRYVVEIMKEEKKNKLKKVAVNGPKKGNRKDNRKSNLTNRGKKTKLWLTCEDSFYINVNLNLFIWPGFKPYDSVGY